MVQDRTVVALSDKITGQSAFQIASASPFIHDAEQSLERID